MAEVPQLDRDIDVLRAAVRRIELCVPEPWDVDAREGAESRSGVGVDALVELTPPDEPPVTLVAEVKRNVVTRDLPAVVGQLDRMQQERPDAIPLVVARYLSEPSQGWLSDRGISYADATGNIRIVSDRPVMFLRDVGAAKDPWRGPGRPRGSLRGEPAARVVRALVDFDQPITVPELIRLAGTSSGATYRVVDYLAEQALLDRSPRGPVETVAWRQILEAWAKDYGFLTTNPVRTYLQPRGLTAVTDRLPGVRTRYAVTGSIAAQKWAPYAPPRAAMMYADDPEDVAEVLGLREVETGANVLIAPPRFDVVFDRSETYEGVTVAAPSQVVVDLLTGPGRGPAEAQEVLNWMDENVAQWRR